MEYIHEEDRIYVRNDKGETIAQIDFPAAGADEVAITRTFVDDSLRGRGVAAELVERVCKDMKERRKAIRPVCSYAVRWFAEHPEKRDVLAQADRDRGGH
ncbi:MAG: N-acetyltransferase [Clostridiales Family XIII bacterium]|jgi:predicted GNAT family acetyltransferase|nr:N-acetyltransferase [Clostridiales Family XIII bacterium]